ncbi:type VII secretion protein EccB [Rhodococcus sp. 27YEA15]|uniref:type VII secretion protein EccB n=1 Tax=Rhodococcus sp. 27YEA15 TaxID=3156259 RepID=UPI003C79F827
MAATPTTRWQVNGYRFLVRRMEHALVRRDVRMLHDPMRSQSRAFTVGIVLATLGLAGCAILALFRPQDKIGNADIVIAKDSGAMFVSMEGTWRPVLNLASARLILGSAAKPAVVKDAEIAAKPRGALVGIPGAPSALPQASSPTNASWLICDTVATGGSRSLSSSVLVGEPETGSSASYLGSDRALLVTAGRDTYLVYDGRRARIDVGDPAITRALGLEGAPSRPISPGMLDAIPEVSSLRAPPIPGAGTPPRYSLQNKTVGSVVKLSTGGDPQFYVLLTDGIQKISPAVAQLIYFADSQGANGIPEVTPDAVSSIPSVDEIAVADLPVLAPEIVDDKSAPVSCLQWQPVPVSDGTQGTAATLTVVAGRELPISASARPVTLAQADGAGPNVDSVYVQPGRGGFVQSTGIEADSIRRDSVFYLSDTGVRYGVPDQESANALGLSRAPDRAPWQMLKLLAPGPTLERSNALIAHDGVAPDSAPAAPVN